MIFVLNLEHMTYRIQRFFILLRLTFAVLQLFDPALIKPSNPFLKFICVKFESDLSGLIFGLWRFPPVRDMRGMVNIQLYDCCNQSKKLYPDIRGWICQKHVINVTLCELAAMFLFVLEVCYRTDHSSAFVWSSARKLGSESKPHTPRSATCTPHPTFFPETQSWWCVCVGGGFTLSGREGKVGGYTPCCHIRFLAGQREFRGGPGSRRMQFRLQHLTTLACKRKANAAFSAEDSSRLKPRGT